MKVLLEGRPGSGKTTVARRLIALLLDRGFTVRGFTTAEIREARERVGFTVEAVSGSAATLAHTDFPGPPRVGRYGVDLEAFERVALPAMRRRGGVLVIDEIGKMELASDAFCDAIMRAFDRREPMVATVHSFRHPVTDKLKARPEVDVIPVSSDNRDRLPSDLMARVVSLAEPGTGS